MSTLAWQWHRRKGPPLRERIALAWQIPDDCQAAHSALIRARLETLVPLLAVLTVAWLAIELVWFGTAQITVSVSLRVGLAVALLVLRAWLPRLHAEAAIHAYVWLQAIGFGLLQWRVAPAHEAAPAVGYGLFPFILAAQLSLLPLPWLRGLLVVLAPAAQLAVTLSTQREPHWNEILLFILIATTAVWASHVQLRLLVDLLGARADAAQDALTGLANRRTAHIRLEAACQRARRQHGHLSVLMLDLDRFKQVNDRWGHANGDRVLVAVAQAVRDELRASDLAVRYGGEEFMALLPDTNAADAMEVAERIRLRIEQLRIGLSDAVVAITLSIGVATLLPEDTAESIVARADKALYAAKDAGRNRCMAAPVKPVVSREGQGSMDAALDSSSR